MTNSTRAEKIQSALRARREYEYFARLVLRDPEGKPIIAAKHQRYWIEAAQDIGDNPTGGQKYLLIAPPGAGKTQLIGVGFTSWIIGKNPLKHFGLLSYADKVGWGRGAAVRNLLADSTMYRFVFPGLDDDEWRRELEDALGESIIAVEPDKTSWGASEFRLKRPTAGDPHPTLRSGGINSAVVSYRLNGLIIDDPMDQKNSSKPEMRQKVFDSYDSAIVTRALSDAWKLTIGTRWADDDFIGKLMSKEKDWKVIHIPALNKAGRSYWEKAYPTAFLQDLKLQKPALFELQYMGNTKGGSAGIIKHLVTYDDRVTVVPETFTPVTGTVEQHHQIFIGDVAVDLLVAFGIDTALKDKNQNDYTVIYIGGLDADGRIWILDRVKGRFGLPELVEKIKELYEIWRPYVIWIEDAAAGTPAVQTLRAEVPRIPTEAKPPSYGGKASRANALSPFLHNGQVVFPLNTEWYEDAKYYLLRVPNAQYDDDLDALYQLVHELLQVKHPSMYGVNRPSMRIRMR